jgi:hypothetical protein
VETDVSGSPWAYAAAGFARMTIAARKKMPNLRRFMICPFLREEVISLFLMERHWKFKKNARAVAGQDGPGSPRSVSSNNK